MTKLERFRRRRLSNGSARLVLDALRGAGLPEAPVLGAAGLRAGDVERPDGVITGAQQLALEEAFVARTQDRRELWLELGFRYRLLLYGTFGLVILNARTVGRAVEFAASFHELAFTVIHYTALRDRSGGIVGLEADLTWVPESLRVFMLDRDLAAVRRILDDMVHGVFPLEEIRVARPMPSDAGRYARALGAPVVFGAERTELRFSPEARHLPMPYGNPILEEAYERQCRELVDALALGSSEVEQVVDLLVRRRGDWPTIEETASRIAVSPRTLRRRLDEQGTSYRALLEGVRRKQAEELLSATRLSVEQIADSLGYAETASFTHAFKRWTGRAPREFRRRSPHATQDVLADSARSPETVRPGGRRAARGSADRRTA